MGGWHSNMLSITKLDCDKEDLLWQEFEIESEEKYPEVCFGAIPLTNDIILLFGGDPDTDQSWLWNIETNKIKTIIDYLNFTI